jgi:copper transport protein
VNLCIRWVAAATIAAATVVVWAPAAQAHPRLLSAEPEPSTTVAGPVKQVVVKFDERVNWEYSEVDVEDPDGRSLLAGERQISGRQVTLPLSATAAGAMRVSWRVVGDDAHPVIGAFVIGVEGFPGAEQALPQGQLGRAIGELGGAVGEGRTGSAGLAWAIRGGRSLEIVLLYVVLGILLLRTLVLRGGLAPAAGGSGVPPERTGPGASTAAALGPDRGYRTMLRVGIVATVAMPVLFVLYVARLQSAVGGIRFGDVVFSSLGQTWTIKTLLWLGIVAACAYGLRRYPAGSRQHDLTLLGLAAAVAVAFGYNTHAIGESPRLVWGFMMWGHLMVTALWAGGLVALLLLVFPTGDPARIWPALGRFSTIMTVTVGAIIVSGLLMLLRLSGSWKSLWCSDFGVVAGFKMAVVGLALVIGLVNNRMVAYQKQTLDAPVNKFRPRRERSVNQLRRLVMVEAAVLGSAVLLSGALGETELPSIFEGKYFPIDLQETVQPGLFGSGCQ